jgi:hypothetical protein
MIPPFGMLGAAFVTALCSWLGAVICVFVVYRLWSIGPPMATLWRSVVISVLAYIVAIIWPATGFWVLVKLSVISVFILLMYLIFCEFSADEIAKARSFLRRRTVSVEQQNEM